MMSSNPSFLHQPEPLDRNSRKFRVICEMHGIKTGAPEDLETFLGKLESDGHFAMDFWAFAGKLSARDGGAFSDDQMLALLVEGITGRPMPETGDAALDPAVALFRAMLAGVDVHPPEPSPSSAPPRTAPVAPIDEARSRLAPIEDPRPKRFSPGLASMPPPAEPESAPTPLPSQLQLALQSLELVSRDLSSHIGKIDQRLSGLETRVTKQASQTEAIAPLLRAPVIKAPERPKIAVNPAALTDEHRRVFESYPSQRDVNWKKNVTLAVVLLTALAIGFSLNYYGPVIGQKIHEIVQDDINTPAGSIWARDHRPPVLLPASPNPAKASTAPQLPHDVPAPQVHSSTSAVSPRESPSRAVAQTEQNLFDLAGAVYVSPAEMERNLIVSRVPIYPETAKAEGLQGRVVAQALISKSGSVTRLHVIEGDPVFRDAATEAILQRRYRPYRIGGSPVDVTTSITIYFRLNG
jgi:TonB family protein